MADTTLQDFYSVGSFAHFELLHVLSYGERGVREIGKREKERVLLTFLSKEEIANCDQSKDNVQ